MPSLGRGAWSPGRTRPPTARSPPHGERSPGLPALHRRWPRFSVTISRRGRAGFAAGDLLSGSAEEQARAVQGFVAYAGRYSFHGDRVIHHVELSLFPNWVGTDQERWVELAGDRLTLSASPLLLAGKQQVPRLLWERANPSPDGD